MSKDFFVETPVSVRARERLREDQFLDESFRDLKYNPEKRQDYTAPSGELDVEEVYKSLGADYEKGNLIFRCVELNLTEAEVRALIEHRHRRCYSGWPDADKRPDLKRIYISWCREFGVEPDPNFKL